MTKKLVPLQDNVIVKPILEETTTASGIFIPETANKEKPMRGKVIAVGPGKLDDNGKRMLIDVKEGNTVIFTQYAPTEIKMAGEEFYILGADSLLAIEE